MTKAVIFDFDGVIADSMIVINKIELDIFTRQGVSVTLQQLLDMGGVTVSKKVDLFLGENFDKRPILEEFDRRVRTECISLIEPIPGAIELIESLNKTFPLAIGTSSFRSYLSTVLEKFNIEDKFQACVTQEDVQRHKPNPDVYLKAAQLLNKDPKECIVIEDAISGMQAAKAAGMFCIGFVKDIQKESPADVLITQMAQAEKIIKNR